MPITITITITNKLNKTSLRITGRGQAWGFEQAKLINFQVGLALILIVIVIVIVIGLKGLHYPACSPVERS